MTVLLSSQIPRFQCPTKQEQPEVWNISNRTGSLSQFKTTSQWMMTGLERYRTKQWLPGRTAQRSRGRERERVAK